MGLGSIPAAVSVAIIKAANHNALRSALTENFVPRVLAGSVLNEAGSLGTAAYRWLNTYTTKLFIGSNNIELSVDNNELIFKIASTEYARITTSHLLPPGLILPHSINANIGTAGRYQFLYCNGQAVSRADYARLYAAIGNRFGEGDGTSTFNVPDLRGLILRALDDGASVDPDASSRTAMATGGATGNNIGSVQGGGTKSPNNPFLATTGMAGGHSHFLDTAYATQTNLPGGTDSTIPALTTPGQTDWPTNNQANHDHTVTVSGGGDTETRMRNAYVAYVIKT